jgi:hypothetical protein
MTELTDLIAARLLSQLMRVCEDPALPGGAPPAGDVVGAASSVVYGGLPASGEFLPLAAVVIAFVVAGAVILARGNAKGAEQRPTKPIAVAQPA